MRVPGSSRDAPRIDHEAVSDLASNSLAIFSRIDVATKSKSRRSPKIRHLNVVKAAKGGHPSQRSGYSAYIMILAGR